MAKEKETRTETPHKFLSFKELAAAYGIGQETLRKEILKIKAIKLKKFQRFFSPKELNIIFKELGKPY